MQTVKGHVRNGVIYPDEPLLGYLDQEVVIVLPDEPKTTLDLQETDYEALTKLIEESQMDTGISDLAQEHDHYTHGTPKRSER